MRTRALSAAAISTCLVTVLLAGCCAKEPGRLIPPAATTGTIRGVVKYVGKKPVARTASVAGASYCQKCWEAQGLEGPPLERWVWGDNDTLQNVLVWISDGLGDRRFETPREEVTMAFDCCRFVPHVAVVRVGQTLMLRNNDQTLHSPHVISQVDPQVGVAQPPPLKEFPYRFDRLEIGKSIKCDVHAWEHCFVHVLPHPFFDITHQAGIFEIKGVPPGEYELSVWHEMKVFVPDEAKFRVMVEAGKATEVDFTYRPRRAE